MLFVGFLLYFLFGKWIRLTHMFQDARVFQTHNRKVNKKTALEIILTCNILGVMFSPGSHRQFYATFYYSLPFLIDMNKDLTTWMKCVMFMVIDSGYYMSGMTIVNAVCIWVVFALILITLIQKPRPSIYYTHVKQE